MKYPKLHAVLQTIVESIFCANLLCIVYICSVFCFIYTHTYLNWTTTVSCHLHPSVTLHWLYNPLPSFFSWTISQLFHPLCVPLTNLCFSKTFHQFSLLFHDFRLSSPRILCPQSLHPNGITTVRGTKAEPGLSTQHAISNPIDMDSPNLLLPSIN